VRPAAFGVTNKLHRLNELSAWCAGDGMVWFFMGSFRWNRGQWTVVSIQFHFAPGEGNYLQQRTEIREQRTEIRDQWSETREQG